jgi:D-alanyl-D-alanine carboxypeptidase
VLGKIIERAYGQTYEQVLKEKILQPLGMKHTGMLHQSDVIDGLADTYFFREDLKALVNDLPVYPENWYAAGAMYSTVEDVLAFSNALFGSTKLLKKKTLALMVTPGLDDYGYGVWSYETKIDGKKHRVVKRPGQIMGAQSQLYHFLGRRRHHHHPQQHGNHRPRRVCRGDWQEVCLLESLRAVWGGILA